MSEAIEQKLHQVIADVFNIPVGEITPALSPESVDNWDSVQHLNLVLAIEESFGIQFDPEEIDKLQNVEGIIEAIRNHRTDSAGRSDTALP